MNKAVYVTGAGVVSSAGDTVEAFFASLFQPGRPPSHSLRVAGRERSVKAFICDPGAYERSPEEYFVDLCARGVEQAAADGGVKLDNRRVCVLFGSGMGMADAFLEQPDLPASYMARAVDKLRGKLRAPALQYMGNACCAGAQAVAYGCDLLRSGRYDAVIAGGAEAFSYVVYSGFQRLYALDPEGCRPFHPARKGIGVGDGAAFFVLRREPGRRPYASLLGHGVTSDAYHIVSPEPRGLYAKRAVRLALKNAGLSPDGINAAVAHGTGTEQNDRVEAAVLYDVCGAVDVVAPKAGLGHTGGASGAFNLLAAIGYLKRQALPCVTRWLTAGLEPELRLEARTKETRLDRVLSNCFAFGGTNVSIVCGHAESMGKEGRPSCR